jgi:serine/threonine protein kinase
MLARAGAVKVLDFGLAKLRGGGGPDPAPPVAGESRVTSRSSIDGALDATLPSQGGSLNETQEGTMLGTPAYFSPEQVAGRLPDEKSEIFTVGVLVYEMATGVSPFAATDVATLFRKIAAGRIPPPDVPEPLARVILRSLASDPADRYADMSAFAAALREAKGVLFAPPKKARWPWVAGGAAVAAAAAAVAVWIATRPPPVSPADRYIDQAIG